MLNYPNQPSRPLFSAATLTSAFTDNRKVFETAGFSKLSLEITYDMDAGETANTMELQLEESSNGTDWFSLVIDDTTTVSVISARTWQMSEGNLNILVDIAYRFMRLSIKETGVATTAGTASVGYTLSGL
jgi:hypothetical protein